MLYDVKMLYATDGFNYQEGKGWHCMSGLTPPYDCACHNPGLRFPIEFVVLCFMFNKLRWKVIDCLFCWYWWHCWPSLIILILWAVLFIVTYIIYFIYYFFLMSLFVNHCNDFAPCGPSIGQYNSYPYTFFSWLYIICRGIFNVQYISCLFCWY